MKFLLVALNAKYIHSNPALYSLRSYAVARDSEAENEVELAEYTINQQLSDILADIYKRKPDAAAFSCYIWNWNMMQELVTEFHKVMPQIPIWLGGPEVSYNVPEILEQYPFLTGIMTGEGEETFFQLLQHYRRQRVGEDPEAMQLQLTAFWPGAAEHTGLHAIAGLVFWDPVSGGIVRTQERALTDISGLPFIYEDLGAFENRILYYESSRGCPFNCSYCLSSIDKKVRLRDLSLVKKELQFFLDAKVPQVKFVDRTFNCNHEHAQEIWRYILEHDNGVTNFHFEISADLLNGEELALLSQMRPGLMQLEIGVQSTNPDTLREIRRYANLDKLRHTVVRIHAEHNIHIHLDLIAGLPFEDFASFQRSFNDVYYMRPEQLQLGFLKVLKGSYMAEMAENYGIAYTSKPPYEVLYTKWLSYEEVIRLKRIEEMVELYYNSNQFSHVLPVLEKQFPSPFDMFAALADFYEENGYFVNSPSRMYRYQVLLDFAAAVDLGRENLYRELLVYDMYLRENLKSRPVFAKDLSGWHDKITDFYKKEETERNYLPDYEGYNARQMQRMTHIELFRWPVEKQAWELLELHDRMFMGMQETAVLFDYRTRDPLTNDARTVEVEL
ncbi:MAG: B12-binding domain-containing radical SAM protein [Eubacteriales bacterium]|nr:B12-binding domain-containing radical SAM protein [Eubacteriales bacterium]